MSNARYNKSSLPNTWLSNKHKPAMRHSNGANYAFADGHVKWMTPHPITTTSLPANSGTATFATK